MTFRSQLIDSTAFQKWKYVRYGLYSMAILYFPLLLAAGALFRLRILSADFIFGPIIFFVALGMLIQVLTKVPRKQGALTIGPREIMIEGVGFDADFDMAHVRNLKFERGSTYHLLYQNDDWEYSGDNWLEFSYKGQRYVYEFDIDSVDKNEEFEDLLKELRRNRIQLEFKSI